MASLANQTISSSYDGLIKTATDNAVGVSGVQLLEDGSGNSLALSVGRANNGVTITGNLAVDTNTLYVDAANNRVGVGTSSPATLLHIQSNSAPTLTIDHTEKASWAVGDIVGKIDYYTSDASGNAPYSAAFIQTENETGGGTLPSGALVFGTATYNAVGGAVERMRIDSSGSVIIKEKAGAFTPATNGLSLSTGYGVSYLFSKSSGGTEADMYYNAANQIFNTGGSERMRIDSSGVVKIGGTDTGYSSTLLHTGSYSSAQAGINILNSTTGIGYILFGDGDGGASYTGQIAYKHGDNYMSFQTADAERMRIDSDGNVGIGRIPNVKFNVFGSGDGTDTMMKIENSSYGSTDTSGENRLGFGWLNHQGASIAAFKDGTVNRTGFKIYTEVGYNTPVEVMRITSGGDVLIGTTSNDPRNFSGGTYGVKINQSQSEFAQTTMYINRSIASNGDAVAFRRDGVSVGSISVTAVSTAYNTSSDYRLKENVVPMENALDRVDALKPSRFNFIADPSTTVDGFLAHEVAEVIPEAISGEKDAVDEEGNPIYQGIDQSKIVPLLVGAIKELKAEIESLKSQING